MPEVIHDFQRAQIKVWMLTGDKFETAKNIGASCKMIQKDDIIYELKNKDHVAQVCSEAGVAKNEEYMKQLKRRAIIVQNEALATISSDENYRRNFI